MTDKIFLTDLRVKAVLGIWQWERAAPQTVSIDLEMATDVAAAAAQDHIDGALDYRAVAKRLVQFVEASEFQLVETLAERVAEIVISEFTVPWVKVTVHKPWAVRGSRDVGICIERSAS